MRKSSKRKPRQILVDPVAWVLNGFKPIATSYNQIQTVQIKNHGAIEAIRQGKAGLEDVNALLTAFDVAEALATLGQGTDWLEEIRSGYAALDAASHRPRFLFTGPELTAVKLIVDILDAQLDSPKTTVDLMTKALKLAASNGKKRKTLFFKVQPA